LSNYNLYDGLPGGGLLDMHFRSEDFGMDMFSDSLNGSGGHLGSDMDFLFEPKAFDGDDLGSMDFTS
jgi:hypothetical protein